MKKAKKIEIPVLIRVAKKREYPLEKGIAHIDDIVAIFPSEPGTDNPRTMLCYARLGEHSSCSSDYAGRATRPATAGEVRKMLAVLRRVGYGRDPALRVVRRASSHHAAERRKAVR